MDILNLTTYPQSPPLLMDFQGMNEIDWKIRHTMRCSSDIFDYFST